jgi:hypothetical protein
MPLRNRISPDVIHNLLKEAQALRVEFDAVGLGYALQHSLERLAQMFRDNPDDFDNLKQLETAIDVSCALRFEVNLWKIQNAHYEMLHTAFPEWRWKAEHGTEEARRWVTCFVGLGEKLAVRVD